MRVAAVNWTVHETDSVDAFFDHCERLMSQCDGAELIVMPEFISLELLGMNPSVPVQKMAPFLAQVLQPRFGDFGDLAKAHKCTLIAGTHFVESGSQLLNAAVVATPDGNVCTDVPKVVMTQFECTEWGIDAGVGLRSLPDQRIGVTVCYDCEFPESARALAENGMLVQCVPAYTETERGFQRVRWSCHARAIENQTFVIHASLVGNLGREPIVSTHGSSAILAPSVEPFPVSAVLAETPFGEEAVAVANIDFEELEAARNSNDVRNWHDRKQAWPVSEASWFPSSTP